MFDRKEGYRSVKTVLATVLVISVASLAYAKDKKGIIMTVDGEDIPTEEFLYLYNKNNQQQAHSQSIDDYLPLFEIYRLKVAEAKKEGIDTTSVFQKEMDTYRRELLEPYITDTVFFNQLVDIAADRENTVVESSHIMIIRTNNPEQDNRNLQLLDSLRNEILNGADFISMAKQYSQDKFSSDKGGYLGFAPAGTFPYGFETAVYETPEGEISEIVESHVGWHIVKSGARKSAEDFDYPVKSYADLKEEVRRKTSSPFDTRYHEIRKHQIADLKERHPELKDSLENLSDDEALSLLLKAEELSQYADNPDYRNLVDEYVNGSLLYEVSVKNVWDKASNDDEGLVEFFNVNRNNYKWDQPHAKGILIQAVNDSVAQVIKDGLKDLSPDEGVNYVKENFKKVATAEKFNVVKGVSPLVDHLMFGEAEASPKNPKFKTYFIIDEKIVDQPEELNDVRGNVVVDYQEDLEKSWIHSLRNRHTVEVNKKELSRIKKGIK